GFVDVGHSVSAFGVRAESAIFEPYVRHLVNRLNLGWGPSHIELKLEHGTPRLIEINYRLGAGLIPDLIALSTGVDLYDATLNAYLGEPGADLSPRHICFAAVRFITAPATGLLQAPGVQEATAVKGVTTVYVSNGSTSVVHPARHS